MILSAKIDTHLGEIQLYNDAIAAFKEFYRERLYHDKKYK